MRYKREQNMVGYYSALESQFTQLTSIKTEFDESTKPAKMILTLKECEEFEPLIT